MTNDQIKEKKTQNLPYFGINKLLPYLKPYVWPILCIVLGGLLGTALDIVLPLFQRYAITNFIGKTTLNGLPLFIVLYVLVILLQVFLNFIALYNSTKVEMYVGRDMKKASFDHLQTLSFAYYNHNSVGYIHSRVISDTGRIAALVSWSFFDSVWNITYLVGAAVTMLLLRWQLALCVLAIMPLVVLISVYFQRKLVVLNRKVRETNSRISSAYNEGIVGAKTSKTLNIEDKLSGEFETLTGEMKRLSVKTERMRALFISLIVFASSTALAIVLWYGGHLTLTQLIELGTLSAFMTYAVNIMEPVQWIVRAFSDLIAVQVNVERFTRLMETESEVTDRPDVIEKYGDQFHPKVENWEPLHGDVDFEHVSFHYSDSEENVLTDFSLHVPQGSTVAIVGETGAGKSTLVNLVCRFFEPTEGRILIDGKDIRDRSQLWLHSNLGYVLQTPHLFSGTILENLRYANPDASMEQIENAVRTVHADTVISKLENGYETDVGEGGNMLSTGEKQLLSFARAILADPRLFVLDEATSSVDTMTEKLIQDAIDRLLANRTCFIIAHRLSTIRKADVILVLENKQVVEKGTHEELMKRKGVYYNLYRRQFMEEQTASFLNNAST